MKNWEVKTLESICWTIADIDHNMPKAVAVGIPFISAKDITEDNKIDFSKTKFISNADYERLSRKINPQLGDIIYTRIGTIGKAAIVVDNIQFLPSYSCCTIRPKKEFVNITFLLFFLKSEVAIKQAKHGANGAGVPDLGMKVIKNFEIPLPPLPEQQRIVDILDECFAALEKAKANAEQNLKNSKELFESYLQGVFENKGEGWEEKTLGEVSKINYGYTEKASFEEVGPKFLRITDIQENGVDWKTVPYCKCSDKDLPKYKLETGDIVFARTGATTGKSYLIDTPPNSVFASYLIRLRMNSINQFIPEFISYFFQTKTYWDKINAGISGSAQGGFNATKLSELEFHFPKSKEQQQSIVLQLDTLRAETQRLEAVYQQKLADLEELKKSILQKAFAGELTGVLN